MDSPSIDREALEVLGTLADGVSRGVDSHGSQLSWLGALSIRDCRISLIAFYLGLQVVLKSF